MRSRIQGRIHVSRQLPIIAGLQFQQAIIPLCLAARCVGDDPKPVTGNRRKSQHRMCAVVILRMLLCYPLPRVILRQRKNSKVKRPAGQFVHVIVQLNLTDCPHGFQVYLIKGQAVGIPLDDGGLSAAAVPVSQMSRREILRKPIALTGNINRLILRIIEQGRGQYRLSPGGLLQRRVRVGSYGRVVVNRRLYQLVKVLGRAAGRAGGHAYLFRGHRRKAIGMYARRILLHMLLSDTNPVCLCQHIHGKIQRRVGYIVETVGQADLIKHFCCAQIDLIPGLVATLLPVDNRALICHIGVPVR